MTRPKAYYALRFALLHQLCVFTLSGSRNCAPWYLNLVLPRAVHSLSTCYGSSSSSQQSRKVRSSTRWCWVACLGSGLLVGPIRYIFSFCSVAEVPLFWRLMNPRWIYDEVPVRHSSAQCGLDVSISNFTCRFWPYKIVAAALFS